MMRWGFPPPPKVGTQPVTNVRNVASPYWRPRTPVQGRQIPAKANSGRLSSRANHTGVLRGLVSGGERALTMMRWGFPPPPKVGTQPVTNVRNVASPKVRRILSWERELL
jgi:putative SOS response-associated peptidase YedK